MAIIPDRGADQPIHALDRTNFVKTRTAIRATIRGQELPGPTFHHCRFA
ncbi:MAG TPA: hypothetical protein VFK45_10920 [Gammaproteobacteria bacterium]|nr:hypothetical protein [Gammaproteobacteria bacterium]